MTARRPSLRRAGAWLLAGLSGAAGAALPTVPAPAPAAADASQSFIAAGLLQAGLGLAVVMTLIFLCAWGARRLGLQPGGDARVLKVVSSVMVGQRERVVVVQIEDTWLVLGVAAGQVSALHSLPAQALGAPSPAPFAALGSFGDAKGFSHKLLEALQQRGKPKTDA